tara:strand:- start:57494 stop:57628 length:135 start_codon:yes stop_codon:yes gene_type:complete
VITKKEDDDQDQSSKQEDFRKYVPGRWGSADAANVPAPASRKKI